MINKKPLEIFISTKVNKLKEEDFNILKEQILYQLDKLEFSDYIYGTIHMLRSIRFDSKLKHNKLSIVQAKIKVILMYLEETQKEGGSNGLG